MIMAFPGLFSYLFFLQVSQSSKYYRIFQDFMKRPNQTEFPVLVILCVLCFQRQPFSTFISHNVLRTSKTFCKRKSYQFQ